MSEAAAARDFQSLPSRQRGGGRRRAAIAACVLLLCGGAIVLLPRPLPSTPTPHAEPSAEPFSAYVSRRQAQSREEGVRPGNEERVVWADPQAPERRAKVVVLYVHGFGASRAEGEAVVEPLAQDLHATTYYTRLPGHGGDLERHAAAPAAEYFARLEEDFHRVRPLGEKLVLIGSSTGGLLTAWLAARHPAEVDAVVLGSPLFALASPAGFLLSRRVGMPIVRSLMGEFRDAGWKKDPQSRKQPGYEDFWITRQRISVLGTLDDIRRQALAEAPPEAISAPILLLYYYADEQHHDEVCSVAAMKTFVTKTHYGAPHPQTRSVAIADGNHILFSRYVRTDKATIGRELLTFLHTVLNAPAAL